MTAQPQEDWHYFTSYSGVALPVKLVNPIAAEALSNRNTFIRALFDPAGRLTGFDKLVYGEVELAHRYQYDAGGTVRQAEITMLEEDSVILHFDACGRPVSAA